ncbi:ABC transporter ATP-binding protein [Tistrella sp. BH-R2-4]|uniref:ABC transporter ATP-binding protein n=1 Tax=Tistrella arctica TaxID=3133430 RepID=A0ABU9YDY7_9PROT
MSHGVALDHVTMRFGAGPAAVDDVDLGIEAGSFFSILGPSGCGKTTLLRMIGGFLEPSRGRIVIGGQDMAGKRPEQRPTAMIFQNLALFPLMTVAENIGFGLEVRGIKAADRRKRVARLLDVIALPGIADKKVTDLSGGQRQRVAIARALAVEPQVLLLDEPLSALDLKLRQHMRAELRSLQKRTGVTFIYITHDQGEALAMSDKVAVMSAGRVQQVAAPAELYDRPRTAFVAGFVGEANRISGRIMTCDAGEATVETGFGPLAGLAPLPLPAGTRASLFVRPERMRLTAAEGLGAIGAIPVMVEDLRFEGPFLHLVTRPIEAGTAAGITSEIVAQLVNDGNLPPLARGVRIGLAFGPADAVVLADE